MDKPDSSSMIVNEPSVSYHNDTTVFNPLQLELINSFAHLNSDEDMHALKLALSQFFAKRVDDEMDRLWNEGKINSQTIDDWKNEHMRTPYK